MSTCISSHGEYSAHKLDASYVCTRCHVLDEDALIAELERARAEIERQLVDDLRQADSHHYTSTACHHTDHDQCRRTCKFCDKACGCDCHTSAPVTALAAELLPKPTEGEQVNLTDQDLAEKAQAAVDNAIEDLAHDRMGLGELLEDELDGLTEAEQDAILDRFEEAIRKHLPTD